MYTIKMWNNAVGQPTIITGQSYEYARIVAILGGYAKCQVISEEFAIIEMETKNYCPTRKDFDTNIYNQQG